MSIESVLLILRIFLFGVFFIAGVGKLLDLDGAAKAAKEFGTPEELAPSISVSLVFAEVVFAFCFLFTAWSWLGALGGTILLAMFSIGMLIQIRQGNAADCHCFGQIYSEPAGRSGLVRNAVLLLLTGTLLVRGQSGQGPDVADGGQIMQTVLILIVAVLAVVAVLYLKRLSAQQTELLKRIDLLEAVSHSGGTAVEREHVSHPEDSLPIGSPFPDFSLAALDGGETGLNDLVTGGRPVFFLFVSPTCEPCQLLLPELEFWKSSFADKLTFVLLSSGTPEQNREKFGSLDVPVLLQKEREIADAVRAKWTPTALLVAPDGRIASHIAAGDAAIRKLVEDFKTNQPSNGTFFVADDDSFYTPPRIGYRVPEFELADVDGRIRTHREVFGRQTVAMFWSPTCPFCKSMADSLRTWEKESGPDRPSMIVFSEGNPDENRDLQLESPIVFDPGRTTSSRLGMWGTPSAVIVNENGTIVSETAVGEANIWALLGRRNGRS